MRPSFSILARLVLLLPLVSPVLSTSSSHSNDDLICVDTNCYPKVFVPTDEFQIIHPDQEIPPGLHIRLNMETGVREGKINVPGEGSELEAATVELPADGKGGSADLVFVGSEEAPEPSGNAKPAVPSFSDKEAEKNGDGWGAIKPPLGVQFEQLAFTDAMAIVLDASKFSTPKLLNALESLENLVHESYWGLKLAVPNTVSALLKLIFTSQEASVRSSAALVLGSSLSNNPKALKGALGAESPASEVNMIETLIVSLRHETDDTARARIMYALNQCIKHERTYADFLRVGGLETLRELWDKATTDGGEFRGKTSTFVEDNFLNELMKADDAPASQNHGGKQGQQPLGASSEKTLNESLNSFCTPFQTSLVSAEKEGMTDDDRKTQILNALVALRRKIGTVAAEGGCEVSSEFAQWFEKLIGKKTSTQWEDEGEWFRAGATELKDEVLTGKKGWF